MNTMKVPKIDGVFFDCPNCGHREIPSPENWATGMTDALRLAFDNDCLGLPQPVACLDCLMVYPCKLSRNSDGSGLLKPTGKGRPYEPPPLVAR